MTPADLQLREAQGLALHCDTGAVRTDRTQARQQLWKACVGAKSQKIVECVFLGICVLLQHK